ncbi:MAG: peptide deformylase [Candidatus Hydrogenedentes bacterium]|nr:peptide deformylase [Candidatus Hydrogenedentota bacterium]
MALLNLVLYPDDPLTKVAEPYTDVGPEVAKLAEEMLETMATYEGVGLAGPQVGVAKRILVARPPEGEAMCLINPEIYEMEGREEGEEGCLSLPNIYAMVPRATRIRVRALDAAGQPIDFEARDFPARIIQHEVDHLDGVMFLDRLDILTRQGKLQEWEEVRERLLAAVVRG